MASKYQFFWDIMELCDWSYEGTDNKILTPLIEHLSKQNDTTIFQFHDQMSELLYHLDTKMLASQYQKIDEFMSDDNFLYSRCVARINGPEYYKSAKKDDKKRCGIWNLNLCYIFQKKYGQLNIIN